MTPETNYVRVSKAEGESLTLNFAGEGETT